MQPLQPQQSTVVVSVVADAASDDDGGDTSESSLDHNHQIINTQNSLSISKALPAEPADEADEAIAEPDDGKESEVIDTKGLHEEIDQLDAPPPPPPSRPGRVLSAFEETPGGDSGEHSDSEDLFCVEATPSGNIQDVAMPLNMVRQSSTVNKYGEEMPDDEFAALESDPHLMSFREWLGAYGLDHLHDALQLRGFDRV